MHQYISVRSKIGVDVSIGNFTSIFEDVMIGKNCRIGNNVTIHRGTIIGQNCIIGDNAVIGKTNEIVFTKAYSHSEKDPLAIGDDCIIGTGAIIYRGITIDNNTKIPDQSIVK